MARPTPHFSWSAGFGYLSSSGRARCVGWHVRHGYESASGRAARWRPCGVRSHRPRAKMGDQLLSDRAAANGKTVEWLVVLGRDALFLRPQTPATLRPDTARRAPHPAGNSRALHLPPVLLHRSHQRLRAYLEITVPVSTWRTHS